MTDDAELQERIKEAIIELGRQRNDPINMKAFISNTSIRMAFDVMVKRIDVTIERLKKDAPQ